MRFLKVLFAVFLVILLIGALSAYVIEAAIERADFLLLVIGFAGLFGSFPLGAASGILVAMEK